MFVVYIPVIDEHELTRECVQNLALTVADKSAFRVLLIDNASKEPYTYQEFADCDIPLSIIRNEKNLSGYYPIVQAQEFLANLKPITEEDVIGFIHNDVFIYEPGWDQRVLQSFQADRLLNLIGFCGSGEVCDRGGRGGGTVCNFDGRKGQPQSVTGRRVTGLEPAVILDSLSMMFRATVIPLLRVDEHICPAHFYDKIWSMRIVDAGLHVAVLGILIDHLGGRTSVGSSIYFDTAIEWCRKHNIPFEEGNPNSAGHAVYLEAERRMFAEFAPKGMIPCRIMPNYDLHRIHGHAMYPAGYHD